MGADWLEEELNKAGLGAARSFLVELRTFVWDGTGLTLEELPEDWYDSVVWRDTGMTFSELIEFLREEE
jgi:hypothetical protein